MRTVPTEALGINTKGPCRNLVLGTGRRRIILRILDEKKTPKNKPCVWVEKGIRKYLRLIKIDEVKQNKIEKNTLKFAQRTFEKRTHIIYSLFKFPLPSDTRNIILNADNMEQILSVIF